MTNNQNNQQKPTKERKIHDLIGTIHQKTKRKVYDKKSPYLGSYFYQLEVALENHLADKIYVFKEYLQKEQIWKDIEESNYIDHRYLFQCSKSRKTGQFALVNWRELPSNGGKNGRPLKRNGNPFNQQANNYPSKGNFKDYGKN